MEIGDYIEIGAVDTLPLISWTINNNCQYRCSYCYVDLQKDAKDNLGSISKVVLNSLGGLGDKFNIELLGGEPTMHPNYIEIVDKLISMDTVVQLTITSNIKKNMDFWRTHPKSPKIRIFVSQHPEYEDRDFEMKMLYIKDNFEVEGLLMLHQDIRYLDRTKKMADFMVNNKIIFEPTMLFDNEKTMVNYDLRVMALFERYRANIGGIEYIKTNGDATTLGVDVIYNNDLHLLSGWTCSTQMYTIDVNGIILRPCNGRSKKHVMLFKQFDKTNLTCSVESGCVCDEYLRWKKWA